MSSSPETFGGILSRIMKEKKMSASQLAKKLGYKSHTSIIRLLSDRVGRETATAFMRKATLINALSLSPDQQNEITRALSVYQYDNAALAGHESLWNYLFSEQGCARNSTIQQFQEGKPSISLTENQWGATFQSALSIEIDIFDSCYESFIAFLSRQLLAIEEKCVIRQYIHSASSGTEPIRAMICAAMMIRFKRYEGMYQENRNAPGMPSFLTDKAFLWITDEHGLRLEIIYVNPTDSYTCFIMSDAEQYRLMFREWTAGLETKYASIRNNYFYPEKSESLLLLSERLLFMELNRSQRTYRPALCFNHLDTELIADAILQLLDCSNDHPVAERLRDIHTKRYRNAFSMKSPTWLVLTVEGMWELARTGYLPDHIKGMAPLPPEVRLKAFQDLLNASISNPYFHLHFFSEETRLNKMMISSYEGLPDDLLDPTTTFDEHEGYYEEVLSAEIFIEVYNDFFDHVLIEKHSYNEVMSRKVLRGMINWLEEAQLDCAIGR